MVLESGKPVPVSHSNLIQGGKGGKGNMPKVGNAKVPLNPTAAHSQMVTENSPGISSIVSYKSTNRSQY